MYTRKDGGKSTRVTAID